MRPAGPRETMFKPDKRAVSEPVRDPDKIFGLADKDLELALSSLQCRLQIFQI